jgi:hypothetical protein
MNSAAVAAAVIFLAAVCPGTGDAPLSLYQACRTDGRRLCALDSFFSADCLLERLQEIRDSTCAQWILARDACFSSARKVCGVQNSGMRYRRCLVRLNAAQLTPVCVNSDFYKSVMRSEDRRMGRMRNRF